MTNESRLEGWKRFCDKRRSDPHFCDPAMDCKLNRFRARYIAAKNFKSVIIDDFSENLTRGYTVGIRLLLSYTAAEILGEALRHEINSWTIYDPSIALAIRDICRKYSSDDNAISNRKLGGKLLAFVNGQHDDLRVAATALRVLVAHGHFAPSGAVYTKRNADAVNQLSTLLLTESERRFVEWLDQRLSS